MLPLKDTILLLQTKDKVLFAVGGIGENVVFQASSAWLFFFWSGQGDPNKALIPIGLLGILMGIGRLIEAFDDPLIGHLSDTTKSRWGRRFPYIFFGAPFLALSFFLLWTPPTSQNILPIYFFLALQFFFLIYTVVSAPYEGILPELAKTSHDRVSTSAWRVLFGVIGAGLGLVGSSLIIQKFGFQAMGLILGLIALGSFWISILGIRKRLDKEPFPNNTNSPNFLHSLRATLKNKHFLIFSLALILFSLGFNLLNSLIPFYVKIILGKSEGFVALFTGILLVSMLLALPLQTKLSSKFGKKKIYAYSMLALGLIFPLLYLVGFIPLGNSFIQTAFVTSLIGFSLSGQFIYPNAILADVIDYDAIKTGLRREAIYYGMQNTFQKISFSISSIIFGFTLATFGSTQDNSLGIRLIGPIAGIFALTGFLIFVKWYTLSEKT